MVKSMHNCQALKHIITQYSWANCEVLVANYCNFSCIEVTINRLREQLRSHENSLQEKATVRVMVGHCYHGGVFGVECRLW